MALPSRIAAGFLFTALAASAFADADGPAPGRIQSTSFAPLPPDVTIAVRPLDDSAANLKLKRIFADTLAKRAVRIQDVPAAMVLNFETEVDQPIRRTGPSFGQLRASNRETDVRVNVWSTTRDSVLGGRAQGDPRGHLRYVLTATLDDERTGKRLWQGQASYTGAPAYESAALAAMAPLLAEQFGRTSPPRDFRLE